MGKIYRNGVVYGGTTDVAGNIRYDNTGTGLGSVTVQNAITELKGLADGATTQVAALPVASAANINKIYQYTGATNANYINGYFYKCVNDNGTYKWTEVTVQNEVGQKDKTGGGGEIFNTYSGQGYNHAYGIASHSEGSNNSAVGDYSHTEGHGNTAQGQYSHAEGFITNASGIASHAEGSNTTANAENAHTEGQLTAVYSDAGHAEGKYTVVGSAVVDPETGETTYTGTGATFGHAEGYTSHAAGYTSHAEGSGTLAAGVVSHAEGYATQATGDGSHAEGYNTRATGGNSHAEGGTTAVYSESGHAEGKSTKVGSAVVDPETGNTSYTGSSAKYAHAEGYNSVAARQAAHAEGESTIASGLASHAEGTNTIASGSYAHAEGSRTTTSGDYAHAEGESTSATYANAHAEGDHTQAIARATHAEGTYTQANGISSHAGGFYTIANSKASTVIGKYNDPDPADPTSFGKLFTIGNGTADNARSNILEVSDTYLNVNGDIKQNGVSIEGKPVIDVNTLPTGANIKNVVYRLFKDKYDGFYMIYNQVMIIANIFQKMGYPCFVSSEINIGVAGTTATITLADDLVYYTESSTDYYVKTIDITGSSVVFKDKTNATLKTVTLTEANSPQIINLHYKVYELYAGDATNQTFTVIKTNNDIDDVEYSYINSEKPLAGYVVKGQVDKIHTELTQEQYDAIVTPAADIEYFITDPDTSADVIANLEARVLALESSQTVYYVNGTQRVPLQLSNTYNVTKVNNNTIEWYVNEPTSNKNYKITVTASGAGNTRVNPRAVITEVSE